MKNLRTKVARRIIKVEDSKFLQYGSIIFGLGLLLVLIASSLPIITSVSPLVTQVIGATLVLLGIIIGFLNVTEKEAIGFMITVLIFVSLMQPFFGSLVQVFSFNDNPNILKFLGGLYLYINTLFVPASIVVALKTLFATAKDEE